MSRVMAIDFGMRRIGVAVSDPLRTGDGELERSGQ